MPEEKQSRGKEKAGDAEPKAKMKAQPKEPKEKKDENFRYIVRLVNTDLDGNKSIVIALAGIKGIGLRTAEIIARAAGIPRNVKIGDLSEEKTSELGKLITDHSERAPHWLVNRQSDWATGADMHLVGIDVEVTIRDDVNLMKMIRCYKGIRHEQGQKVRGQRTRANGRTGLTMGVIRKREGPAQATQTEE